MRVRCQFAGRVQGVGFRATAKRIAGLFPVSGWVRNESDGSVMMEVQGTPEDVDAVLDHLLAEMELRVRGVDRTEILEESDARGFRIC